jgi:hypothetical protein|eukprot:COSAG06_NODE_2596_length_6606_cov_2.954818_8_plen_193_part_00
MYRSAAHLEDDPLYLPAGQMGYGWWDDAFKETKRVAKKVQSSDAVRALEKRAVAAGAKAVRGAVEGATDGLATSALSAIGAPELAPAADALIDRGAKALQRKGTEYLDQQIDASGRGVRYMAPSGGGLRTSSTRTMVGRGLRLSGEGQMRGHGHCGCGHGQRANGLRLSGSGMYVPAGMHGLVHGNGHGVCA